MAAIQELSKAHVNRCGQALRAFDPDVYDRAAIYAAIEAVDWWRARHAKPLARVNAGLRYYVKRAGSREQSVAQRLKRFETIVDKLDRFPSMHLTRMEDIGGVRAILDSQRQVDAVAQALIRQPKWKIRRLRQYVDGRDPGPKDDGYRAVHVIVERDGCFVEVQLRTPWQDAWAQSVEKDTRRLRSRLKFGDGPIDLRQYYSMIAELFAIRERLETPSEEFMNDLAKMFALTRQYFPTEEEDQSR